MHASYFLPPPLPYLTPHYFTLVSWDCILNEISWPNFFVSALCFQGVQRKRVGTEVVLKRQFSDLDYSEEQLQTALLRVCGGNQDAHNWLQTALRVSEESTTSRMIITAGKY